MCDYVTGFVNIDCGIPDDSGYNDETTGIKYVSDGAFVESRTITIANQNWGLLVVRRSTKVAN